jgi:hypothetical protein
MLARNAYARDTWNPFTSEDTSARRYHLDEARRGRDGQYAETGRDAAPGATNAELREAANRAYDHQY